MRGLEVSPEAWAWATANRDRLGLDVDLALGDATQPCFDDWAGAVDVVTINPPYIPVGAVPVDPEVRDHDPEIALYGGSEDGLAIPLAVVRVAAGAAASRAVSCSSSTPTARARAFRGALRATGQWTDVQDHPDLAGRPRVTTARRSPATAG